MSIEAKIQELMLKKKKIDYLKYVEDLIRNDTKCIDYKSVKDDVVSTITPHIMKLIQSIENDTEVKYADNQEFSPEQFKALVFLADRVNAPKPTPSAVQVNETPAPSAYQPEQPIAAPKKDLLSHNDKMNFAMNNRHLADKRVQVLNDANTPIYGKVVGLDAPHIIVKTEAGPTINVPVEKVNPV